MIKLLRALKSEQRKLWSKGSILSGFVIMFVLSFALSFFCSVLKNSGADVSVIFPSEHTAAAFAEFDERTPWRKQAEAMLGECEKSIADAAVALSEAEGSRRAVCERQMAAAVREKAILQYRIDNDLSLRDWSGYYALILCIWMMIPVAAVITVVYASDMFAGEYSRGTIRVIVSRPVTRIKMYIAKVLSSLFLGWLLLAVAYAAAGIGCGVLMSPAGGTYVGYVNGSVYTMGWGRNVFSVFLCGCAMIAVVVALCAAVGYLTRSRGASAVCACVLALAGMFTGRLSGGLNSAVIGMLLPFSYDITVPLCGVAYNSSCSFLASLMSLGGHFLAFLIAGYSGMKKDI